MKGLWWKEWQQTRAILLFGVLLVIGTIMPWAYGGIPWPGIISANVLCLFGVFLGAGTVATEAGDGTSSFLLAMPVSRTRIWFVKVALRMLELCLVLMLLSLLVDSQESIIGTDTPYGHVLSGLQVFQILCTTVLLFGFALLSSGFIDKVVTSALAGIVLTSLFLIGLNALLEKMIHPGRVRAVTLNTIGLICSLLPIMGSLLLFTRREAK